MSTGEPVPGSFAVKSIPIILLAIWVFADSQHRFGKAIGVGLLFSSGGDVALDFNREALFPVGLGFFLLAHLCYIYAFLQSKTGEVPKDRMLWALPIALAGGGTIASLYANVPGDMRIPVVVYVGVIVAMAITAALRTRYDFRLVAGALIFMASDAMIAINKFGFQDSIIWAPFFIMTTYYGAQVLIAWGGLAEDKLLAAKQGH
jgi:uncharacterized membrane protein YhhN